ncbi:MAG: hypothetical protein JSW39_01580 [Desulfobacterales bacterium]|nr:MAG: hypothetical protein JSW39_01580 [Desulfobacterales bacterium]
MNKVTFGVLFAIALLLASPWSGYAGGKDVFVGATIGVGHPGRWGGPPARGRHHEWRSHGRWRHDGWRSHGRWRHSGGGHRHYWSGTIVLGPWYPYSYYYAAPPVVIQQQPPVYAPPEPPEVNYWYYCQNPQGYYPYVKSCPGGWMKVVPETTPPNQ